MEQQLEAKGGDEVSGELKGLALALLVGSYGLLREELPPKLSGDQVRAVALAVVAEMTEALAVPSWDEAEPMTIAAARTRKQVAHAVRLVGYVDELRDPRVLGFPVKPEQVAQVQVSRAWIVDFEGAKLGTLALIGESLIQKVQELQRAGQAAEFLGIVTLMPDTVNPSDPVASAAESSRDYFLHLVDARPSDSALDLLGATAQERQEIETLRSSLTDQGTMPLDWLQQRVIEQLGIVGLEDLPELRDLLEFTVLQAVSSGRVDNASARLHGLVIGPPGQGKQLVGLAAKVLNPVAEEVSGTKVSVAGLVGSSSRSASGWRSQPGALPRAAQGVAVVQDAHGWKRLTVEAVAPVLQEVMQEGRARNTMAGGGTFQAATALLVDLNRTAHLGNSGAEAPILGVRPLLTRFDLILELPRDVHRPWKIGQEILGHTGQGLDQGAGDKPDVRTARLLVAYLRDLHAVIDLSPVTDLMQTRFEQIHSANIELFEQRPELADFPARLAISFKKLVAASARAGDRSVASPEDVDRAVRFLDYKLRFLRMHDLSDVQMSDDPQGVRQDWLLKTYGGQDVDPKDVAGKHTEESGVPVNERTIRRDLKKLGAKPIAKGRWLLPPAPLAGAA